jgi:hypothetical protein
MTSFLSAPGRHHQVGQEPPGVLPEPWDGLPGPVQDRGPAEHADHDPVPDVAIRRHAGVATWVGFRASCGCLNDGRACFRGRGCCLWWRDGILQVGFGLAHDL